MSDTVRLSFPIRGRWVALLLLAALVGLALSPRIPKRYGGDLWLWVAGYFAVLLLLRDTWRHAGAIRDWWAAKEPRRRTALAALTVLATLAGTLAMRSWAPWSFGKLSREQGLWEPLSLLLYWGSAIVIYRTIPRAEAPDRRSWLAVAGVYTFLGFEEIDWFSIFGGLIGRIDGVYAGSLHDLIRLLAEGVLSPAGLAVVVVVLLLGVILLWRSRWLDPRFLARLARKREFAWFAIGFALLWVAASEEAHLFGWVARPPTPEEAVELVGALCLGIYALELVTRRMTIETRPAGGPKPARTDRGRDDPIS
ncbi:MAG: hypothetical protein ACREMK_06630 [Gemmatimonadota bacterium]